MSVNFVNNRSRIALAYAKSSAICQFPCAAIRNVRETLGTLANSQTALESTIFISTYSCAVAGAIAGGAGAITANYFLESDLVASTLSGISSCLLTGLISGTCAHYCIKKRNDHAVSLDPKSENEEMLPEITENNSEATTVDID